MNNIDHDAKSHNATVDALTAGKTRIDKLNSFVNEFILNHTTHMGIKILKVK